MTRVVNLRNDEEYDVYIGRGSLFGNPFTHLPLRSTLASTQVSTRAESIERFREYFLDMVDSNPEFRAEVLALRGKVLGCYCKPLACHGDVIVEWLDRQPSSS